MNNSERPLLKVPEVVSDLIGSCETLCVADCCGWEAFEFFEENVIAWVAEVGMERAIQARHEIDLLIKHIGGLQGVIACNRVNIYWTPQAAISFFEMFSGFLDAAGVPVSSSSTIKLIPPPPSFPHAHITQARVSTLA